MKKLLLFLIVCAAGFSVNAQLDQVVNELYGTRTTGEEVYRVYAELTDPTDFVSSVFAANDDVLSIGSDVGNIINDAFGSTTGDVLNVAFCGAPFFAVDVCLDSYVTIGWAGTFYWDDVTPMGPAQPITAVSTVPAGTPFADSFGVTPVSPNLSLIDGSWFAPNLPGVNSQGLGFGLNNRVLIAQVAVPIGGSLEYCLNIQVFDEANGAANLEYVWDVATANGGQLVEGTLKYPPTDVLGCTDTAACNYDSTATLDDGTCTYPGCLDTLACNYDSTAGCADASCTYPGCTDTIACNYDSTAGCDDGSCTYPGCNNSLACNYDSTAGCDDGSCCLDNCVTITVGGGSFDSEIDWEIQDGGGATVATGFAPDSQDLCLADDCYVIIMNDSFGDGWNGATWSVDETGGGANYGSGTLGAGLSTGTASFGIPAACGCTDPGACNYDSLAVIDDGSCILAAANDLCANAIDLGGASSSTNVDNTAACQNEGADGSCHFGGDAEQTSVWYSITLAAESYVTLETVDDGTGSFGDTQLAVFDGCGGAELACDDDAGPGLLSLIDMGCTPAGTYLIQLDGFAGATGTVDLNITIDGSVCPQGCTDPGACNYDSTALFDDGSCSYDNDGADCALAVAPGPLNAPNCVAGDLTGSTPSPESQVFASTGEDRWYSFVAQSPGVAIYLNTTDFDAMIELHSTPGTMVDFADDVFVAGSEILNIGTLTEGATYYVAARAWGGFGTGLYDLCIETLPDTRCDYGPGPYGVCATFKADWVGSDDYLFNFLSQTTGTNYTHQSGFAYTFVQLGDVAGLEYNDTYDVAINSIYNRVDGSGAADVVIVDNNEPCIVIVDPHPLAAVNPAYNCTNSGPLFLGQYVPCNPWICGNTDWEWEFTRTDVAELPITHFRGSTNRYLRLSDVSGLVEGGTYDVRVRPVFAAASSNFGGIECIQIIGSGGAPQEGAPFVDNIEDKEIVEDAPASVAIYPNPVTQNVFTLNLSNVQSEVITLDIIDLTGKRVQGEQITVSNGMVNTIVELNDIASGVYMVNLMIDGQMQTERLVVQK